MTNKTNSAYRKDHFLYATWRNMNARCRNPDHPAYPSYGGRGITVCRRWLGSSSFWGTRSSGFPHFVADMEPTWFSGAWLERIDNNGGYSPGNCCWATPQQQGRNRRNTVWLGYQGESLCLPEILERTGLSRSLVNWRRRKGWPAADWLKPANAILIETELGPMTMREAVWYYEIGRNTLRHRLRRGKTWSDGLFEPVDQIRSCAARSQPPRY